jgi:hypothetical protein
MASFDFSGIVSGLAGAMPNQTDIINNVLLSAASGVVLAGLKQQVGNGSLDPIGLFHGNTVTPANNPNNTVGPTITASAFASLPPGAQTQMLAAGVHVVAG